MSIQSRLSKGSSQRKCTLTLGFPVSDGDNYRDLIASVPLFPLFQFHTVSRWNFSSTTYTHIAL